MQVHIILYFHGIILIYTSTLFAAILTCMMREMLCNKMLVSMVGAGKGCSCITPLFKLSTCYQ